MNRRIVLSLRLLAAVVMLGVLIRRVHIASLFPEWKATTALWLLAGLALSATGVALAAWRWGRVLHALDLQVPYPTLLNLYLAGLFIGNFLPSTVGGDVLRMRRLVQSRGLTPTDEQVTVPFASVVLERLTGWIVLPILTLVALTGNPGLRALGHPSRVALAISLITLVALVLVTAAAMSSRVGGRLAGHESWLRFLGAVHLGLDRFRRHPMDTAAAIGAAAAYQLVVVATAWTAAKSLDVDLSPTAALAFVPVVAIVQVAPVTLGGLGIREGAFVLFLGALDVPAARAVALGLLLYGLNLAVSLCGAPSFAMGAATKRIAEPAPHAQLRGEPNNVASSQPEAPGGARNRGVNGMKEPSAAGAVSGVTGRHS